MKTIDLNKAFIDLSGVEVKEDGKEILLGKVLANSLAASTKGDALKYYDWAVKLHKGEEIKLDNSDFKKIYDFVEKHEGMSMMLKAQILNVLDAVKESKEEAK